MRFDNRNETHSAICVAFDETGLPRCGVSTIRYDTFNLVSCEKHFRQAIFAAGGGRGGVRQSFGREKLD